MRVKYCPEHTKRRYSLSPEKVYEVLGIEADEYRIIDDNLQPYLFPKIIFEIVDAQEPTEWITEYGENGEKYSYPPELNAAGFFEDYFDGNDIVVNKFKDYLTKKQMPQVEE